MSLRARLPGRAGPLLGAAVGLLIAVTVTLLQDSVYRAEAAILLVRQGQPSSARSWSCISTRSVASPARTAASRATPTSCSRTSSRTWSSAR